MASFIADITDKNMSRPTHPAASTLAVIHCKVKKTTGVFSKIQIETSLDADWKYIYKDKQLLLDKITVQVGYANDKGDITYKNSALISNYPGRSALAPMIWTKDNCQNIYCAAYTASQSLSLLFSYSAAFKINEALPVELQNAFTGKQMITINPIHPSDYSVKISII